MPFTDGYVEKLRGAYGDRQDAVGWFVALSGLVVRSPLSTFAFRSESPEGKDRFLFVDRDAPPREGGIVLLGTGGGFRLARYDGTIPRRDIWGTVVWFLEEA